MLKNKKTTLFILLISFVTILVLGLTFYNNSQKKYYFIEFKDEIVNGKRTFYVDEEQKVYKIKNEDILNNIYENHSFVFEEEIPIYYRTFNEKNNTYTYKYLGKVKVTFKLSSRGSVNLKDLKNFSIKNNELKEIR